MRFESAPFPRFNLSSMSGVYAGTRSDRFYRLRLWVLGQSLPAQLIWYQLQLPPSQEADADDQPALPSPALPDHPALYLSRYQPDVDSRRPAGADPSHSPVVFPLVQPDGSPTLAKLESSLTVHGLGLHACSTCTHWHQDGAVPPNRQPASGRCTWQSGDDTPGDFVADLDLQSALALGCAHWQQATGTRATTAEPPTSQAGPVVPPAPQPRSLWTKLRGLIDRNLEPDTASQLPAPPIAERSGVGAGTEACFACYGRLANLGALVVESEEGDPLTYSVWRCRVCRTSYLNRWADRWVRMDNLETDESFFRIAPAEAAGLLQLFHTIPGADHPKDRGMRTELRARLEVLAQASDLISRQVRQGR